MGKKYYKHEDPWTGAEWHEEEDENIPTRMSKNLGCYFIFGAALSMVAPEGLIWSLVL